jgi:endonuclease/exonuclease/phosphatase family metal-dependent hydrolase
MSAAGLSEGWRRRVRVATFNVFSGRADDGSWDRSRFADAVASLDAGVLALQEVDVGAHASPARRAPEGVRDESRVAIVAEIETPARPREVVCTHLNMRPRPAVRVTGPASLAAEATFPAHRPRGQIDHVPGPPGLRVVRGGAVRLPMSDHRALVVDV